MRALSTEKYGKPIQEVHSADAGRKPRLTTVVRCPTVTILPAVGCPGLALFGGIDAAQHNTVRIVPDGRHGVGIEFLAVQDAFSTPLEKKPILAKRCITPTSDQG